MFSGDYKYIEDCSEIVDVYDIDNNYKLSIDGIIGDENICYIKFTMERLDGEKIDCSYALFDKLNYDFKYSSGGFSYSMVEDENKNDNKISFLLDLSISKGFRNKKIEFNFKDLIIYKIDENNIAQIQDKVIGNIKVVLSDGSTVNLKGSNVSSSLNKICIIKQFKSPIDIENVKEIIIEGYSVNVK